MFKLNSNSDSAGIYGAIGGLSNALAAVIVHPADVIKTNFQTDVKRGIRRPVSQIIKSVWKGQRFFGFYRGLAPQLSTYPMFWMSYHSLGRHFKKIKLTENDFANKTIASYLSAGVSSALTNPFFVIKTNMQVKDKPSVTKTISKLYQQNGVRSFYKGLPATLINNSKLAIQFPISDHLQQDMGYSVGLAAFIAKASTTSVFYPLDLIRVMQRNAQGLTILNAAKIIYKQGGCRGFYRGVLLYNCVSTPSFVLMEIFRYYATYYLIKGVNEA